MRRLVIIAVIGAVLGPVTAGPASDADTERLRSRFLDAYEAALSGNTARFESLASGMEDYVLYPYLEYAAITGRIGSAGTDRVRAFLERYDGDVLEWRLRDAWLKELARRRDWLAFLEFHTHSGDPVMRCHHAVARLRTGNTDDLVDEAKALWLSGQSLPDACDPMFDWLYDNGHVDDELRFERTALALEAGNTGLASWLARELDGDRRVWYRRWREMIASPGATLEAAARWEDDEIARRIARHGLFMLARGDDGGRAWDAWLKLDRAMEFPAGERGAIYHRLALDAATDYHPAALARLAAIPDSHRDVSTRGWRVRVSLQRRDWPTVLDAIEDMPQQEQAEPRWRYWRARALEATGNMWRAFPIYGQLSGDAGYYGFLAADRLGRAYEVHDRAPAGDAERQRELAGKPAMARALELHHVGLHLSARREWHHALRGADDATLRQAALLALRNDWHDRVIAALADSGDWNAYGLRFPLAFESDIRRTAEAHNLDLAWMYALIRAESGFITDAQSPAGALGLMQVMPGTGRDLSGKLGLSWRGSASLSDPRLNVTLGARYLADMLDRYEGNIVLATAAYNAGPHRVDRWVRENSPSSAEIWAETIPFYETRDYIQRVLAYTAIYDWRLDGTQVRLSARLPQASPALAAGVPCRWPMIAACR